MTGIEKGKQDFSVPKVYELFAQGAPAEAIARQLYADARSRGLGREKIALGMLALLARGDEGLNMLAQISKRKGVLANVARAAIQNPTSEVQLEEACSVRRWGEVIKHPSGSITSSSETIRRLHAHAVAKGYTTKSLSECVAELAAAAQRAPRTGPELILGTDHIHGTIEHSVITENHTFGAFEPTYLELVGPLEILRLRAAGRGNFLLLGSMGKYSAQQMSTYARKIHPAIRTYVIDVDTESVAQIRQSIGNDDVLLAQADAKHPPFADESMRHVYTNFLFHYLFDKSGNATQKREDIAPVIAAAYRVLEPSGSLVLAERVYGTYKVQRDHEGAKAEILSVAQEAGFTVARNLEKELTFRITNEASRARISPNGFPHYEGLAVTEAEAKYTFLRLVKPERS